MATYVSGAITFAELQTQVLQELHEALPGTEAVPLDLVKDKLNLVYLEAFNDQRMNQTAREANSSFTVANDTTLDADFDVGDVAISVEDATTFQSAGQLVLQSEIVTYTSEAANVFTLPAPGLEAPHYSSESVRQAYTLATIAPNVDTEQIHYVDVNGIPQTYMTYEQLLSNINFYANSYSIYQGHLILSRQSDPGNTNPLSVCLMVYSQTVNVLEDDDDVPTLIPNSFRAGVLVNGACYKIAAPDDFRTPTDYWKAEYEKSLAQYIAFKNTRVRDINNKQRPTVWLGRSNSIGNFR